MPRQPTYEELEQRAKQLEVHRDFAAQLLETVNMSNGKIDLISKILLLVKEYTGIEAVGIRLKEGEDFPYYKTDGFSEKFVEAERYLCTRDQAGEIIRDSKGNPYLECMCGNVLCGRVNPELSFFTVGGSFWTNSTTELLASTTDESRQARTRNRCHGEGYESVALIPLQADNQIIGLLQLNDRQKDQFTHEIIRFFEKIGSSIGISFHRKQAEEALQKARDELEQQVEQRTAELQHRNEQLLEEIEERKRLEAQIRHAQKMEAIGTLSAGIAHDFNNILQAISGYVEILLMAKDQGDPDRGVIEKIENLSKRAGKLVGQLLTFSRKVESKLRPVDLNHEVMQSSELLKRSIPKMVRIEYHLSDDLNLINADAVQIGHIMMNLGINAKDAMPDGGKLIFKTKNITFDEQYCRMHPGAVPGDYVLLSVSDTGHGMDKEIVEHIFEPFFTTKDAGQGTGLGLAMVYGIVKSHGGYIMCNSELGRGTIFRIYFPALKTETAVIRAASENEEIIPNGRETILLVDDEDYILEVGKDILEQFGYKTITAENGEKAVEIFGKAQRAEGRGERLRKQIDLVILDVSMPGMGGYECLKQLLKIDPKVKAIISSGYSESGKVKKTLETCAAEFVGKPYQLTDMLKKVRAVLDSG